MSISNNRKAVIQLNVLRSLVRERVRKLIKESLDSQEDESDEEEKDPTPTPSTKQEDPPLAKPEAPSKPEEDDEKETPAIIAATDLLISKVKRDGVPEQNDLTDAITSMLQAWGLSSEAKLSILKTVRNNTLH